MMMHSPIVFEKRITHTKARDLLTSSSCPPTHSVPFVRNNCELVEYGGDNEIVNLKGISSNSFFSFLNTHTFGWGRERN
jgi:hypothetical protein